MAKFRPLDPANWDKVSAVEREMGIQFIDGDAGDISSREAGNMVKKMIEYAEKQLEKSKLTAT